ncbi:hypothetical protein FIU97_00050 [Roseivivax sp. THAF40]|uniref:PepSY domain-containing protein n=1 Tax=Roseivivax sp. THAF40 TaxID=2587858 RepID=UPI0012696D91|nr:PepSY domain-containing protein [Roseivivax sp. THAF40]QFT44959.1 hypothetical protein FIU97_00050 [Roseivivax sp. THAF40]
MKLVYLTALVFSAVPFSAMAMPAVGDLVGSNPEDATAALEESGCMSPRFEAEDGKIEAKCKDADGKKWEVYIAPNTGLVTEIKADD